MQDGKGEFLALKNTVPVLLMSNGRAFQSFSAAQVKEWSPRQCSF